MLDSGTASMSSAYNFPALPRDTCAAQRAKSDRAIGDPARRHIRTGGAAATRLAMLSRRDRPAPAAKTAGTGRRAKHGLGKRRTNARHPLNACSNSYAILKSELKAEVFGAGFGPIIGSSVPSSRNRTGLMYDLMEQLRPSVDRKILEFARAQTFTPSDFMINTGG